MSRAYVFSGQRPSQALMSIDSDHALRSRLPRPRSPVAGAIGDLDASGGERARARRNACFASSVARCQPAVSRSAIRRGVLAAVARRTRHARVAGIAAGAGRDLARDRPRLARLAASTPVQL